MYSLLEAPFRARRAPDERLPLWLQFGMRVAYVVFCTVVALLVSWVGVALGCQWGIVV